MPAFACRTRYFCPSCQAKRAALFAEHLGELRAPVAHRHYVFTIPKALRALFPRGGAFVPVESDARARGPDGRLLVRAGESEVAFSPLELIHALAQQIPDRGQHLVRYYGADSSRARRLYRAAVGEEGGPPPAVPRDKDSDFERSRRRSWARLLRKPLELGPLLYMRRRVEMKVVAVTTDTKVIDCILAHLEATGGNDPFDARRRRGEAGRFVPAREPAGAVVRPRPPRWAAGVADGGPEARRPAVVPTPRLPKPLSGPPPRPDFPGGGERRARYNLPCSLVGGMRWTGRGMTAGG